MNSKYLFNAQYNIHWKGVHFSKIRKRIDMYKCNKSSCNEISNIIQII